jgi:SHS2 domain-containing protein
MYETFDHTADLGLRVRSPSLDLLFAEAAEGLFSLVVDDLSVVKPQERLDVDLENDDRCYLLFDWLNALLFDFDVNRRIYSRFAVNLNQDQLSATAWGEPFDESRHRLSHEVKAITYHGLRVEQTDAGWLAEAIVDI